ncbi:transcription factor IME1 KNAG_0D01410 [Huiozyma naganishii CBS 8797]|uniref:Uncharacterized protein n=1 Tax=Huiozyma naganishii (strain ATCC MYA-139 / BCRC 22969 / CBS 8797 / KCTC 17520 / NBRC 10181 / NCYC 3082 / Yp74L-3) TaxID=1071383 RepID=J7RK60_HUIN7|nr:hypothetical protein KNAG_0D01410 [Kazachstania naganishii CBS 8797]CCK69893.1 hypothetical protein KNAG_0D01410 [Kazachstania naganishii CBS 8797]
MMQTGFYEPFQEGSLLQRQAPYDEGYHVGNSNNNLFSTPDDKLSSQLFSALDGTALTEFDNDNCYSDIDVDDETADSNFLFSLSSMQEETYYSTCHNEPKYNISSGSSVVSGSMPDTPHGCSDVFFTNLGGCGNMVHTQPTRVADTSNKLLFNDTLAYEDYLLQQGGGCTEAQTVNDATTATDSENSRSSSFSSIFSNDVPKQDSVGGSAVDASQTQIPYAKFPLNHAIENYPRLEHRQLVAPRPNNNNKLFVQTLENPEEYNIHEVQHWIPAIVMPSNNNSDLICTKMNKHSYDTFRYTSDTHVFAPRQQRWMEEANERNKLCRHIENKLARYTSDREYFDKIRLQEISYRFSNSYF